MSTIDPVEDEFKTLTEIKQPGKILFIDKYLDPDLLLLVSCSESQQSATISSFSDDFQEQQQASDINLTITIQRIPKNDTTGEFPCVITHTTKIKLSPYFNIHRVGRCYLLAITINCQLLFQISPHQIKLRHKFHHLVSTRQAFEIDRSHFAQSLSDAIAIYHTQSGKLIRKLSKTDDLQNSELYGCHNGQLFILLDQSDILLVNPFTGVITKHLGSVPFDFFSRTLLLSKDFAVQIEQTQQESCLRFFALSNQLPRTTSTNQNEETTASSSTATSENQPFQELTFKNTRRVIKVTHFQTQSDPPADFLIVLTQNPQFKEQVRFYRINKSTDIHESKHVYHFDQQQATSLSECITFHGNELYFFMAFNTYYMSSKYSFFINKLFPTK